MLQIKPFILGPLGTWCYLVWDADKNGILFDCGGRNLEGLTTFIKTEGITLKTIVLTHGHGDHIIGLKDLVKLYPDAEVVLGKEDAVFLKEPEYNLVHYMGGEPFTYDGPVTFVKDGDTVGPFTVIDSPGHTVGSKCFYARDSKLLISGDTMFKQSFGRYDLPTASGEALFRSLKKLCDILPPDTVVYSGHTEETSIGAEKIFLHSIGVF
ncbi:MAG: MBL fold metallo-hydrolase [Fusobacteriaceae bacterium]|jgi:hydroxyacylglutathione hydrolase|nr:MBL fold metallo-hydrolase [Fusobacteriaceae bacterium]